MDKYRRATRKGDDHDGEALPNEVRITTYGKVHGYVSYATNLLTSTDKAAGTSGDIVLKAMGVAISKAVTVAEILKHRIPNIHTVTNILSVETEDVYEPLEEGLDVVKTIRRIPSIKIQLALNVSLVDLSSPGYQKPIPLSQVNQDSDRVAHDYDGEDRRETRGGGRGRKPRGGGRGGRGGRGGEASVQEGETAAVEGASTRGENGASPARKERRSRPKKNTTPNSPQVSPGGANVATEAPGDDSTRRSARGGRGRGRGRDRVAAEGEAQEEGEQGGRGSGRSSRRRGPKPAGDGVEVISTGVAIVHEVSDSGTTAPRARTAPNGGSRGRGNSTRSQPRGGGRGEGKPVEEK